jgi:hypothetical protein
MCPDSNHQEEALETLEAKEVFAEEMISKKKKGLSKKKKTKASNSEEQMVFQQEKDLKPSEENFSSETSNPTEASTSSETVKDLAENDEISGKNGEAIGSFEKQLDALPTVEEKIHLCLQEMKEALSQEQRADFKKFWNTRNFCLALFKSRLNPQVRSRFWTEYMELSTEARKLRDILDEQTAFEIEQISLAIQAIKTDVEQYEQLLEQMALITFPERCREIALKSSLYSALQREISLLTTFASRVNALRKGVIHCKMRIKQKNQLLQELALLGDQIFPKRKDLIQKISQEFIQDILSFVEKYFQPDQVPALPYFVLREEIKHLQNVAKLLSVNTQAFVETREKLSECWNIIRDKEKEYKKQQDQKEEVFLENAKSVDEKILQFQEKMQQGLSTEQIRVEAEQILQYMRQIELGKEDVRRLKTQIRAIQNVNETKEKAVEDEKRAVQVRKHEEIQQLKDQTKKLLQDSDGLSLEAFISSLQNIQEKIETKALSKMDRQILDKLLKPLKTIAKEKKEKKTLSPEEKQSLEELREILQTKMARRKEIKELLEEYRKAHSSSGFDFEKAIMYRDLIDLEKNRLDKMNSDIAQIEEKIAGL